MSKFKFDQEKAHESLNEEEESSASAEDILDTLIEGFRAGEKIKTESDMRMQSDPDGEDDQ